MELILSKNESKYGPFRLEVAGLEDIAQSRVFDLVNLGTITLIMAMTTKEREEKLLPIRIPVYKGLCGYRIFIINRKDQKKFAKVKRKEQ